MNWRTRLAIMASVAVGSSALVLGCGGTNGSSLLEQEDSGANEDSGPLAADGGSGGADAPSTPDANGVDATVDATQPGTGDDSGGNGPDSASDDAGGRVDAGSDSGASDSGGGTDSGGGGSDSGGGGTDSGGGGTDSGGNGVDSGGTDSGGTSGGDSGGTVDSGGSDDSGGGASEAGGGGDAASDASIFGDGGVCLLAGTTTLYVQSYPAASFTAPATTTLALSKGFLLSGKVTLPSPPAARLGPSLVQAFPLSSSGAGQPVQQYVHTGTTAGYSYSMVLAPGSYAMAYSEQLTFSGTTVTRYAFDTIDVCGDAVHDVALAALPAFSASSVTVSGLDTLGTTPHATGWLVEPQLESDDHSLVVSAQASAVTTPSVIIPMLTPGLHLTPFLLVAAESGTAGTTSSSPMSGAYQLDPITPSTAFTLTVPPVVALSGTVTGSANLYTSLTSVAACETTNTYGFPNPPVALTEGTIGEFVKGSTGYRAYVHEGINCPLFAQATVTMAPTPPANENPYGTLLLPGSPVPQTITSATTFDVTIPTLSPPVTSTFVVQDSSANPLAGVGVVVTSTPFSGGALDGDIFTAEATTDATGTALVTLPAGTYTTVVSRGVSE